MKDIKKYYLYIFVIGLVNAVYQLGLIKQLHVGRFFNFLSVTINFIVALTLLSLGVGVYISRYFGEASRKSTIKKVLILLAVSILLTLLFILLFLPSQILKPLSILIIFVIISIPMILIGISVGLIYPIFLKEEKIGFLVFFHILGFGLGQIIGILFIRTIGANSLFLLMFTLLFLLIRERRREQIIIITIFLILIFGFSLEDKIEVVRERERILWSSTQEAKHVFSGWSPYSKIDFYQYDTDCIAGAYNYRQQWMTCKDETKDFQLRKLLYPELIGDILVIGTGGGISINSFGSQANVTAVEIDPLVIQLMKGQFREYNNDAYNRVNTYAEDGRAFLESNQKKYDYIVFEGVDYTPSSQIKTFIRVDNYLYTKEGLHSAMSSLEEEGVLLIFFSNDSLIVSKTMSAVFSDYFHELRKFYLYSPIKFEGFLLTISKSEKTMEYLSSFFDNHPDYFKVYKDSLPLTGEITDNQPFLYIPKEGNILFYFFLSFLGILAMALISLLKKKSFYFYFFLLGIGMMMGELFFINIFRSLYSDYITTFVVVSIIFFSGFSIGAYYYKILKKYILLTPFLMLASLLATNFIPWSSGLGFKFLFSILVLFPPALFMGVFFPLALVNIKKEKFPLAYLLDSIGGAIGFFMFYISSILFGFTFSFFLVCLMYFILLILVKII